MANKHKLIQASIAFDTLCEMLDEKGWKYTKDEKKLAVFTGAVGDNIPIDINIIVDADRQLISLLSKLPFTVPEEERVSMAVAVSAANYTMVDGSFDYNPLNGNIYFRMTSSFVESPVSKDMFEYMLYVSCSTVDNYNSRLLLVAKDSRLYLEDFIKMTKE